MPGRVEAGTRLFDHQTDKPIQLAPVGFREATIGVFLYPMGDAAPEQVRSKGFWGIAAEQLSVSFAKVALKGFGNLA